MVLIPDILWVFYTDEYFLYFWSLSVTDSYMEQKVADGN